MKRERGKQKAVENNARVKALSEQKRQEREAQAAAALQASATTNAAQGTEDGAPTAPEVST